MFHLLWESSPLSTTWFNDKEMTSETETLGMRSTKMHQNLFTKQPMIFRAWIYEQSAERSPYHWLLKWLSCVALLQLKSRNFCAVTQEAWGFRKETSSAARVFLTKDLGSSQSLGQTFGQGQLKFEDPVWKLETRIYINLSNKNSASNLISAQQKYNEGRLSPWSHWNLQRIDYLEDHPI